MACNYIPLGIFIKSLLVSYTMSGSRHLTSIIILSIILDLIQAIFTGIVLLVMIHFVLDNPYADTEFLFSMVITITPVIIIHKVKMRLIKNNPLIVENYYFKYVIFRIIYWIIYMVATMIGIIAIISSVSFW